MKTQTITRKIGINRGRRRLWIEGAFLKANGFDHGVGFDIEINAGKSATITANPDGKRSIAGTAERPIIDWVGAKVAAAFSNADSVEIAVARRGVLVCKGK